MRWILEYRLDEKENKYPKARTVILEYFEPDYSNRPAASPTMTRNTRQLLLQLGSCMEFSAAKGDVSGASSYKDANSNETSGYVPELAAALNVAPGDIIQLKKAAGVADQHIHSSGRKRMALLEVRPWMLDLD